LSGSASTADTGDIIGTHLRRLIPFSLSVLYVYDVQQDLLEAKHALGDASSVVRGLRIPLGQRLSGWVAANRQTISNSDPMLDLGELARAISPPLRSCISAPLIVGDELVGVLSLYSTTADCFTDEHRRVMEAVTRQIGHRFKASEETPTPSIRDSAAALLHLTTLDSPVGAASAARSESTSGLALIFIDVIQSTDMSRTPGDEILTLVAHQTRACLRTTDVLLKYAKNEFVALLNGTNKELANGIATRIRTNLQRYCPMQVNVNCAISPNDGESFDALITAGRSRVAAVARQSRESVVH
jgi:putative methionine-R-sulfoxide reductase with GAF domain